MSNTGDHIRKSLLKRQEALERFKAQRESFLAFKERTQKDIEEAREIWEKTLEQLPKQVFN
jgi:cytochrome c-type biogenesis protein CcmH/NrfG